MRESKGRGGFMAGKKRTDNKGRVLRNGEMQRSQDGRYVFKYFDISGKRKMIYAVTLVELREKEQKLQRDLQDGIDTHSAETISLNDMFDMYMETKQKKLRESTKCNYNAMWNHRIRKSSLVNMKLSKIKPLHIDKFYADMAAEGLAEKTIRLLHHLIFPALEMAVDNDYIRKNPSKNSDDKICGAKKERKALSIVEHNALLDFIWENPAYELYSPMIAFALATGLRVGELTGLRWENIDLKNNKIFVRQQLLYKNYGDGCRFHIQKLKTDAGLRDIPMRENARKALFKQKELLLKIGKRGQGVDGIEDFVFVNSQGNPFATNAINLVLDNIVKDYNKMERDRAKKECRDCFELPHISAHILRHTACTRFAEEGLDAKTLQIIMGHSNISITLDTYTHLDNSTIQERIENLEESIKIV